MRILLKYLVLLLIPILFFQGCGKDTTDPLAGSCTNQIEIDSSLGDCSENLPYQNNFGMTEFSNNDIRTITSNNIPNHAVGLFGAGQGSLNPNAIIPQNSTYTLDLTPSIAYVKTQLLGQGPEYSFGILLNGIEVDPVAAEPWPHQGMNSPNTNWEWNLEASMAGLGIDCNRAHVQPTGAYHYHGTPSLYINSLNHSTSKTLIGFAADGFPIYYAPAMTSSYQIKSGERGGDGINAPCGEYDGLYTADYQYVEGLGDLGECNEYYDSSISEYYYVLSENYPGIPRCFIGTPSNDFAIGGNNR